MHIESMNEQNQAELLAQLIERIEDDRNDAHIIAIKLEALAAWLRAGKSAATFLRHVPIRPSETVLSGQWRTNPLISYLTGSDEETGGKP